MKNLSHICPHDASSQFDTAQGVFCIDCGTLRAFSPSNKPSVHIHRLSTGTLEPINFYEGLGEYPYKSAHNAAQKNPKHPRMRSIVDIRAKKR